MLQRTFPRNSFCAPPLTAIMIPVAVGDDKGACRYSYYLIRLHKINTCKYPYDWRCPKSKVFMLCMATFVPLSQAWQGFKSHTHIILPWWIIIYSYRSSSFYSSFLSAILAPAIQILQFYYRYVGGIYLFAGLFWCCCDNLGIIQPILFSSLSLCALRWPPMPSHSSHWDKSIFQVSHLDKKQHKFEFTQFPDTALGWDSVIPIVCVYNLIWKTVTPPSLG